MRRHRFVGLLAALLVVACVVSADLWAAHVATLSFCPEGGRGTFPGTLAVKGSRITVDLSALPARTAVFRAVLQVRRDPAVNSGGHPAALRRIVILDATDTAGGGLALRGPRFRSFDVTAAVRAAMTRDRRLVLQVTSFHGWQRAGTRLDVTCAAAAKAAVRPVTDLRVRHAAGQTFIAWKDPYPHLTKDQVTIQALREAKAKADTEREVRFRIYRSKAPLTAATVGEAELLDEVGGFTAFNGEYYGVYPKKHFAALRYVVWEGEGPLPPDGGVYVHKSAAKETAYYAVSVALNGEERLSAPVASKAVKEEVGPGAPVLQRIARPKPHFNYVRDATVRYYVKWESPPTCNLPSRPFDYLVAVPPVRKGPPTPLHVALHCWGANLNGGYGWWYNGREGAMMVATNQIPYDWWACYHEHLYTLKPFNEGLVRNFSPKRVWAFVEWVKTKWQIDETRITLGGSSMGGAGVSHWLRYGDRFAYGISWVGVHIPAKTPGFRGSYEGVVGRVAWRTTHESGIPAFDYMDDAKWLRAHPRVETPFLAYANGKNDAGIGWPQAVEFTKALQETRRPHLFVWGQGGHGQRAYFPTPTGGGDNVRAPLDIRLDRSLPAFTNCSLDDNMGSGDPKDGDPKGQLNMFLRWLTGDIVDRQDRYEITLYLIEKAPKADCAVNVTPRRLRQFKPKPGETLTWASTSLKDGKEIASGSVKADRWGLVTIEGLQVSKDRNRLVIKR